MFISLVTQPSFCFTSLLLQLLFLKVSVSPTVYFKILQQKAISFGPSYFLNTWYRLHHYSVYHKDTAHVSIPKVAGRVLCKHWQVGQEVTSEENCRRPDNCSPFVPHRLLLRTRGTKLLLVSGTSFPSFTLLGSANTNQPVGHLPHKASLWESFLSLWNIHCEERW